MITQNKTSDIVTSLILSDMTELLAKAEKMATGIEGSCFSLAGFALPGRLQLAAIVGEGVTHYQALRGAPCVNSSVAAQWDGIAATLQANGSTDAAALLFAVAAEISDGPDNITAVSAVSFIRKAMAIISES